MNYRPPHFKLQELVAPSIFERLGDDAWNLLDEKALRALESIREKFGPIIVNNWHAGGQYKESGLREQDTRTGAPKSAHKRGMAFDCKSSKYTPAQMCAYVMANPDEFPYVRRIENPDDTRTWLHVDSVEHAGKTPRVFKP